MANEELSKIVDDELNFVKSLLIDRGIEYADNEDKLIAFKKAAAVQGCSEVEALCGMMSKHTVSIYDMSKNHTHYSIEKWTEKITDHINYLLLLKALIIEGRKNLITTESECR